MDSAAKPPSLSPEVEAFRRYYNELVPGFRYRPLQIAESLYSDGIIRNDVTKSVGSTSTVVKRGKVVQDAFQQALVQSSDPRATMQSLRRAFEQVGWSKSYFYRMEQFVDGECTIWLIQAR